MRTAARRSVQHAPEPDDDDDDDDGDDAGPGAFFVLPPRRQRDQAGATALCEAREGGGDGGANLGPLFKVQSMDSLRPPLRLTTADVPYVLFSAGPDLPVRVGAHSDLLGRLGSRAHTAAPVSSYVLCRVPAAEHGGARRSTARPSAAAAGFTRRR